MKSFKVIFATLAMLAGMLTLGAGSSAADTVISAPQPPTSASTSNCFGTTISTGDNAGWTVTTLAAGVFQFNGTGGADKLDIDLWMSDHGLSTYVATFVYAGDGNDVICGGDQADEIHAQGGADDVWGRAGNDTIFGNGGWDTLYGNNGNDFIQGMNGNDYIEGGLGNDRIDLHPTLNQAQGAAGNQTIYGGGNTDRCGKANFTNPICEFVYT